MSAGDALEIVPSGAALGAEVRGIDLTRPLPPGIQAALRQAWLEHLVLVFRDQPLDPEGFLAFARGFGRPVEYPFVTGIDGYPEIIEVKKLPHETVNFGGIWHTDTAYLEEPPMASTLLAREVPPTGGDTLFANMYRAWETLPADTQRALATRHAVNVSSKPAVSLTRQDRLAGREAPEHSAVHPVARTHPETGRRSLYVNVAHTIRFTDLSEADSVPLLESLFEHQVRDEFLFRLTWRPGTIALWDNRCTLHFPLNDYAGHRRVMHRITLAGDRPR